MHSQMPNGLWRHGKSMPFKLIIALALSFYAVSPASATRMQEVGQLTASLTVVPPTVTTTQQLVEIRLGLMNTALWAQEATVQFYASLVHPAMRIMGEAQKNSTQAGTKSLVKTHWAPVAFQGKRTIIAVIQRQGWPDIRLEWPLTIVAPTPGMAGPPIFTAAWLEPGALRFLPYPQIAADDIRLLVRNYKERGISLLILAYAEFGGCFYYPTRLEVRWPDYASCQLDTRSYDYLCPNGPKMMYPPQHQGERCPWAARFDVFETVLDEADKQGMYVMLGLGRSGDIFLSLAIEDYYLMAMDGIPNGINPVRLNARLGQIKDVSTAIVQDLWQQYKTHPSLYGWAISHELSCYDVSRNLYDPVARVVKESTMPDRPIMVAPYSPRNCLLGPASIPQQIRDSAIDIYMYQDSVGSSTAMAQYDYDPLQRIAELPRLYQDIARWHAGTGKHLWVTVEIWRAAFDGDQRTSLTGLWMPEVLPQITSAAKAASVLVLNEGLFYVDNSVPALRLPLIKQPSAASLTQAYRQYLLSIKVQ